MEIAEIVLAYIRTLTWPAVTVTLIYLLRDHLTGLVDRIRVISTPAGELEFAADVNQLHEAVVEAADEDDHAGTGSDAAHGGDAQRPSAFDALRDVAVTAPEAAIMAAWRRVELRLSEAQQIVGDSTPYGGEPSYRVFPITPRRWAERLVAAGLDADVADLIAELVALRNRAAHSIDISGISAIEYVESCAVVWVLLGRFMAARQEANPPAHRPDSAVPEQGGVRSRGNRRETSGSDG
ncbi:hypothetical protein [Streptomyces sp. NPDC021224]|uniref:hypothetical protein n=1 Tax=unclassified Streptomyces TaxID=2593676 RepID=UPI0037AC82CB